MLVVAELLLTVVFTLVALLPVVFFIGYTAVLLNIFGCSGCVELNTGTDVWFETSVVFLVQFVVIFVVMENSCKKGLPR